jgi:hypothetical protein
MVLDTLAAADLVLAVVAALMTVALVAGAVLPVATSTALAAGGVPAGGTIGYALFSGRVP